VADLYTNTDVIPSPVSPTNTTWKGPTWQQRWSFLRTPHGRDRLMIMQLDHGGANQPNSTNKNLHERVVGVDPHSS
jgi:hypothetical protein